MFAIIGLYSFVVSQIKSVSFFLHYRNVDTFKRIGSFDLSEMTSHFQAPSDRYKWVYNEQTTTSIYLKWDKPASKDIFDYTYIKYRKEFEKRFTSTKPTTNNEINLYNLTSDVLYVIKAFIQNDQGDIIKLFETICRTNPPHLTKIIQESTLIREWEKLHIYKLPCIVNESDMFKQCHLCKLL